MIQSIMYIYIINDQHQMAQNLSLCEHENPAPQFKLDT